MPETKPRIPVYVTEKLPVRGMRKGEIYADEETGTLYLATGPVTKMQMSGHQLVFVQSSAPNFGGNPGLWVQTGLANGGMTIWIEDGL